ncbi:hypothetical protein RAS1_36080 [Phycisphaerae bacterium RAS1]|nr:hypothetical protein RAS1_36080 [Phycisphaerae bacterium RAS1]
MDAIGRVFESWRRLRRTTGEISCALLLLGATAAARAGDYVWNAAAPANAKWHTPGNWTPNGRPGANANDTAKIDIAVNKPIEVDADVTLKTLLLKHAGATLRINPAKTFKVTTGATIDAGELVIRGAWEGKITNQANGKLISEGASDLKFAAAADFGQGGTFMIRGVEGLDAEVTTDGFTNSGTLTFNSPDAVANAALFIKSTGIFQNGTLNNNGGTINFEEGKVVNGQRGWRYFSGDLVNRGTINVRTNVQFAGVESLIFVSDKYTNHGNFNIAAGGAFYCGANSTFDMKNGGLVTNNNFFGRKMTFEYNGGGITGEVTLRDSTLRLAHNGAATFNMRGNDGKLTTGIAAGQHVRVIGDFNGQAALRSKENTTNSGTLTITSDARSSARYDVFTEESQVRRLTNANNAVINIDRGRGGWRGLRAELVNQNGGKVQVNTSADLGWLGAKHANDGQLFLAAGATLAVSGDEFVNNRTGKITGNGILNVRQLTTQRITNKGGTVEPKQVAPNDRDALIPTTAQLVIDGDFEQLEMAALDLDLDASEADPLMDQLVVTGLVQLEESVINLSVLDPNTLQIGQRFTAIDGEVLSGVAPLLNAPQYSGLGFEIELDYASGNVDIVVVPEPATASIALLGLALLRRR